MTKINTYTLGSNDISSSSLSKQMTGEANMVLLTQALHIYQDRQHRGLARAKTRSEVDITKKKIYKQKGTGGARHGARSAPIFVGGGVTHGPKGVKRELHISRVMGRQALLSALFVKSQAGRIVAIEGLSQAQKTNEVGKTVKRIVKEIAGKKALSILFVLPSDKLKSDLVLRNIANSKVVPVGNLNAYEVMKCGLIVLDASLVEKATTKETKAKSTTKKPAKRSTKK